MKRKLEKHCCTKPVKYKPAKVPNTGKEDNSMIYIYNEQRQYDFYTIRKINQDQSFQCTKLGRYKYECELTPEFDWSLVGVFKMGPSSMEETVINRNAIHGKVIKVNNLFITCPENVLKEQ